MHSITPVRIARALVMLALPFVVTACCCGPLSLDPYGRLRRELSDARAAWERADVDAYHFTVRRGCFCPATEPITAQVNGETVVSRVFADNGQPAPENPYGAFDTVEELFARIEAAINDEYDDIEVEYHSQYGYPVEIDFDPIENAIDDESSYTVSAFQPLTPG